MNEAFIQYLNNLPESVRRHLPGDILLTNQFQPTNRNRLTGNKFIFGMTRCPSVTYFCQRANIPDLTMGVSVQSNPTAMDIKRPGTRHTFGDLNISFAVDEEMKNWLEIYNWIRDLSTDIYSRTDILPEHQKTSSAEIMVLNSAYRPIYKIKFYDTFPIALTGIDFDSTSPDTQSVISNATFNFTRYEIQGITAA
jgi:hypothetical protein